MERRNRKFLLVVLVPKTEPEHANIKKAVTFHSGGDLQLAFLQAGSKPDMPFVVGYVFTSDKHPRDMGFGLLNPDAYLLVELGDLFHAEKLSVVGAWLQKRRGQTG